MGGESSSSGSHKSHSNPSSVKVSSRTKKYGGHKNKGYQSDGDNELRSHSTTHRKHDDHREKKIRNISRDIDKNPNGSTEPNTTGIKRSSQSSQGSTDSNHSSHVSKMVIYTLKLCIRIL